MAYRPYTERFVRAYQAGVQVIWTVPAGKRAVIRNIVCVNPSAAAVTGGVSVDGYYVWYGSIPASVGNVYVETRVVAYAGDNVIAQLATAGATIIASGYLFDDSSGATRAPGDIALEAIAKPEQLPHEPSKAPWA